MSLSRCRFACLALFAGALAIGSAHGQNPLRYQFKQGEKLHYVAELRTSLDTGQGKGTMGLHVICDVTWEVATVGADGKAKIALKIDRVQITAQTPQGKMEIDSKTGQEPTGQVKEMLGDLYSGHKDAEITMNMDARGNASDIHLPKALVAAARKAAGGPGMGETFTEDGLKRHFGLCGLSLPESSVTKGQSWDHAVTIKFRGGNLQVDTKYSDEGPTERKGKKLETIALKPTLKLEGGRVTTRITIKKQDAQGTAYFDNAAGRLVEVNVKQQGEIEVGPEGVNPQRKVESAMSWKLVDKGK
jgi:hypothetical protein